jgi:hypothetical protein
MPRKKTYEVLCTAYKTYVVEATSKEEALDIVCDEVTTFTRGWDFDAAKIDDELKTKDQIEASIRHGAEDLRRGR